MNRFFETLRNGFHHSKLGRTTFGRSGNRKNRGELDADNGRRRRGFRLVGRRGERNRDKQQIQRREKRQNRTSGLKATTIRSTPVGVWLRRYAPDVLRAFADMVPAGFLLDSIASLIETRTFKKPERDAFKVAMTETREIVGVDVAGQWSTDMNSDSWLSKNVRPLVLLSLTCGFVILVFANAIAPSFFQIDETSSGIFETLLLTVFGAYFAGRTIEKTVR
jgi:hypothetical protein